MTSTIKDETAVTVGYEFMDAVHCIDCTINAGFADDDADITGNEVDENSVLVDTPLYGEISGGMEFYIYALTLNDAGREARCDDCEDWLSPILDLPTCSQCGATGTLRCVGNEQHGTSGSSQRVICDDCGNLDALIRVNSKDDWALQIATMRISKLSAFNIIRDMVKVWRVGTANRMPLSAETIAFCLNKIEERKFRYATPTNAVTVGKLLSLAMRENVTFTSGNLVFGVTGFVWIAGTRCYYISHTGYAENPLTAMVRESAKHLAKRSESEGPTGDFA